MDKKGKAMHTSQAYRQGVLILFTSPQDTHVPFKIQIHREE